MKKFQIFIRLLVIAASYFCLPSNLEARVLINEVSSANVGMLNDEDGDSPDWIELYNDSAAQVSLEKMRLSNGSRQFEFSVANQIASYGYLVVFASGKNRNTPPAPVHLNFKLSASQAENLYLIDQNGAISDSFNTSPMEDNFSQGRDSQGAKRTYSTPTPGRPNEPRSGPAGLVINEVQYSGEYPDDEGDFSDWIELYNPSAEAHDLSLYSLCQGPDITSRWFFPSGTQINAGGYLLVFASAKNHRNPTKALHTDFKLSSQGELIRLFDNYGRLLDEVSSGRLPKFCSFGRKPNGNGIFFIFQTATPAAANTPLPYAPAPTFSPEGGFYSAGQKVAICADNTQATIEYTVFEGFNDRGEPLLNSGSFVGSGTLPISNTCVIRAQVKAENFLPSPVSARSYFINFNQGALPVVSVITDENNLFDPLTGIYVEGPNSPPNYQLEDEERQAYVEFYEPNGTIAFSQAIGLRITGSGSREVLPRPLALMARNQGGTPGSFAHQIFPCKGVNQYESFVARNSNQDGNGAFLTLGDSYPYWGTFLRNSLVAELAKSLHLDFRAARPAHLFFEGAWWGITMLAEKISEDYISANHPYVQPQDVDLLTLRDGILEPIRTRPENTFVSRNFFDVGVLEYTHPGQGQGTKGVDEYIQLVNYMCTHNLNDPASYGYVQERLDIESAINYFIIQIYSANLDWPTNNVRIWRDCRIQANGLPGKWKYIVSDSDFTFDLVATVPDDTILEHACRNSKELWALMGNDEFRRMFFSALFNALEGLLSPDKAAGIMESLRAQIRPFIEAHLRMWDSSGLASLSQWERSCEHLKSFLLQRYVALNRQAEAIFGINSSSPRLSRPAVSLVLNEVMGSNATTIRDEDGLHSDWLELKNTGTAAVDLEDYIISNGGASWVFPSRNLEPGSYLMLWASGKDKTEKILHTNFKISSQGSQLLLADPLRNRLDSLQTATFTKDKSFGRIPDGTGDWVVLNSPSPGKTNVNVSDEAAQVVINEIMGNNKSTIKDACNNYSDWVELKNIGSTPVDLTGFSLTDGSNVPWEFPASTVLQPGAYLLVWASNETLCSRNNFQANFNISKEGQELIRLADAQGRTVDFRLTAPFMPDRSQGRNPDGTGVWSLLDSPTPATVNSGGTTANQPPYISAIPPKELKVGQSLAVAIEAIDTDGDALLYIVSSSGSFSHFSLSGNMINFAPQAGDEGAYNITVIVDDRHGHQSRISFSLTVKPQQAGPVLINEVMGNEDDNSSVSKDIDGDANDWIELINTSNEAIDVSGYSLTDGSMPSPPGPRKFPNPTVIPAHGYLLVWASNKRRVDGELRANFKIDANGETLILANANGQAIHTIITGSFNLNKTKGLNPNGEDGTWQELAQPTPGSSNNPSGMARTFVKRQPPRALPSTIKQKKTTLKNKRVAGNFQGYAEK